MSDRTGGRDAGGDSFDLGESKVGVRKAPRGRSLMRILTAALPTALGVLTFFPGFMFLGLGPAFGLASLFCGLGFAIYDYRGPFGPRSSMRTEAGPESFKREAPGREDY